MSKKTRDINNPFSSLKGFSVSTPDKNMAKSPDSSTTKRQRPATPSSPPKRADLPEVDEGNIFLEEMRSMGLTQKRSTSNIAKEQPVKETLTEEESSLFLDAISEMGPTFNERGQTFNESGPEKIIDKHATARFEKLLRQKKITPQEKLDLHGQYADEAIRSTLTFLQHARQRGATSAIIITGKGYGSKDGPVLKPTIEKLLKTDASKHIIEWCQAPPHLGGSGALVVLLRKAKQTE